MTAIVAAMAEELAPLRARLVGVTSTRADGLALDVGRLGAAPVVLAVTGDGARHARHALPALLARHAAARVIVVGVAGAATPDLGAGALVAGERVVDARDGAVARSDAALVELAVRAGARRGVAVTAERIADTADEKRRLRALAAAACPEAAGGPVTVDLESALFAAEARRAGLPVLVLRAVSDTADEPLPALLNRSRDEGGAVRRGRVALGLLADPRPLRQLLALRERVAAGARELARATTLVVEALAHAAPSRRPAEALGQALGQTVGQILGQIPGQTPGQTPGKEA